MKEIQVGVDGAGKRLDKFLARYLSGAPKPLLYAQLRKKNITLNGGRASGSEVLQASDAIQCFFSDATWTKFLHPALRGDGAETDASTGDADEAFAGLLRAAAACYRRHPGLPVLYEDEALLLADKPVGLLAQSASAGDPCLNDWLIGYLLARGELKASSLAVFRPSVCHRLDRNTGGIVVCAKTLAAAQETARLFREHEIGKYYLAAVHGEVREATTLTGTLVKNRAANRVTVEPAAADDRIPEKEKARHDGAPVRADVRPLFYLRADDVTLIEAKLVTGKPHQLRAQLAAARHPIVGDEKYGGMAVRDDAVRFGARHQLLHCARVVFPALSGALSGVSGKTFVSEAPFAARFSAAERERTP